MTNSDSHNSTYSTKHYGAGNPKCKICKGAGYLSYNVPLDHPKFGRIFDCKCRVDDSEETLRKRAIASGVGDDAWKLEGTNGFWSLPGRKEIEEAAQLMVKSMKDGDCKGWLTFVSAYGLGKTAIGQWMVLQAIRAGQRALFITAYRFSAAISNSIDPDKDGDAGDLSRLLQVDLAVIDQPEKVYQGAAGQSYGMNLLWNILNERYSRRETQATVLLTNLDEWEKRKESGLKAIWDRTDEGKVIVSRAGGIRAQMGEHIDAE